MSAPALSAAAFADHVIEFLHDVAPDWWLSIAPAEQKAAHEAYQAALTALGDTEHAPLINRLDDCYREFVLLAYAAGLRHGAIAEQFRAALKA